MKKLIKLLSLIVVITLFSGVTSFAVTDYYDDSSSDLIFSDITNGTDETESILNVAQTGIISGYDDGTFRPNNNVTRAECATMICKMIGINNNEDGTTQFIDVPSDYWALGYIKGASQAGIISGYDDTTFGPNDNVLYEQAIKMLICAMDEQDLADEFGGYPNGYIKVAQDKGILDNVPYEIGVKTTRKYMAKMIDNSLKCMDNAYINAKDDDLSTIID